jgi:transcriptional regulator with XRE-family HTH domain
MDIKDRIRALRKAKNLSQGELGNNVNLSLKTISSIETGKIDLSTEQLKALSSFFNVSADYLLTGKEGTSEISADEQEVIEIMRGDDDFKKAVTKAASFKKKAISYLEGYKHTQQHTVIS